MNHYKEYLIWRGDLLISEDQPFGNVDNLVLCALSYVDLGPVIRNRAAGDGGDEEPLPASLTIREACEGLLYRESVRSMIVGTGEGDTEFVRLLGASARFGECRITDYIDILDSDRDLQFAAFTVHLPGGRAYIAFRGTDDSIAGWKEDFMISYTKTGSQRRSLGYVREMLEKYPEESFYVGGHSKGGNLSLYSTAMLTDAELMRIEHVYSNDGPGFCEDVLDPRQLDRIQDITTRIIPYFSVIGRLFEPAIRRSIIVQSDGEDMLQHDPATWGVSGRELLTAEENDPTSIFLHETFSKWIESAKTDERQQFVDTLFSSMADGGTETITQLTKKGPAAFENMVVQVLGADAVVLGVAASLPEKAVFGNTRQIVEEKGKEAIGALEGKDAKGLLQRTTRSEWTKCAALVISGLFCILLKEGALNTAILLALLGVTGAEIALTVMQLKNVNWDFEKQPIRIVICVIMIASAIVCMVKEGALFLLSSGLFGIVFLYAAFDLFAKLKESRNDPPLFLLHWGEMIMSAISGIFILIAPQDIMHWYMTGVGILLILDAILKSIILIAHRISGKKEQEEAS